VRFFVGVYWAARREGVVQCARRLEHHLSALAGVSENLKRWVSGNKHAPDLGIDAISSDVLVRLLENGVNRKEIGQAIIPELGFSVGLWNRDRDGWSAGTSVTCGLYSRNKNLSNFANLRVEAESSEIPSPVAMVNLLERLIEVWEPDNGRVEQTLMTPSKGGELELGDVCYASYWTTGRGSTEQEGVVVQIGRGQLWKSSESKWRQVT
jgi:hypothetical protein